MTKIIDYNIIEATTIEQLVELVEAAIEGGWQPLGGAVQYIYQADRTKNLPNTYFFYQTLVKYK